MHSEYNDVAEMIEQFLECLQDGSLERFRQVCENPALTVMYDNERRAILAMIDHMLLVQAHLPPLSELIKKRLEFKSNANKN